MAKKKKETCPYCGKQFAYLTRHKCKIKERVEGEEEDKTEVDRRIERIEETKKKLTRSLKKEEKIVLNIIEKEKDIYFNDLMDLTNKSRANLENIIDVLALQSKIKILRELLDSSWTKKISIIEDYSDDIKVKDVNVSTNNKDFLWNYFGYQPCFICPYSIERCNETNPTLFNPHYCPWLTEWIGGSLEGKEYKIAFDDFEKEEQFG